MHTLGICREAHYSESSTPAHLGPRLESPQGPSLTGLMVDPSCAQRPQLGSLKTPTPLIVVIFFTMSRFRFLMWYLRAPDVNAWRKQNRSASFLRPGTGSWSRMTPLCSAAQQPRGPDPTAQRGECRRVGGLDFKTRTSAYKQMLSIF